jgi:DNA ligase-1
MKLIKPMLAHKLEEKRDKVYFPGFVQPKLDGVRCTYSNGEFRSRSTRLITSVPKLLTDIQEYYGDYELDGELFTPSLKFEDINSCISRTVNIVENMSINYWVYDIPRKMGFRDRWQSFQSTLDRFPPIRFTACPTYQVRSYDELLVYFKKFIDQGFEGLIYRHPDCEYEFDKRSFGLLKLKPWHSVEAKVIGFDKGKGRLEGSLGAMICQTLTNNKTVKVGSGLTDQLRSVIWSTPQDFIDKIITIKYQEVTKYGVPRFPVFLHFRESE